MGVMGSLVYSKAPSPQVALLLHCRQVRPTHLFFNKKKRRICQKNKSSLVFFNGWTACVGVYMSGVMRERKGKRERECEKRAWRGRPFFVVPPISTLPLPPTFSECIATTFSATEPPSWEWWRRRQQRQREQRRTSNQPPCKRSHTSSLCHVYEFWQFVCFLHSNTNIGIHGLWLNNCGILVELKLHLEDFGPKD